MRRSIAISMLLLPAALLLAQDPPPPTAPPPDRPPSHRPPPHFPHQDGRDGRKGPPPDGHGRPDGRLDGRGRGGPNEFRGGGKFPPMFDTLAKMTPEDREKALAADPHFNHMPPERQAEIRERIAKFGAMTPEQQQLMRDRFGIVSQLPPSNRDRLREVFPQWRKLPEDRRKATLDEFRSLSAMSPADREKRMADAEFQKAYSAKEQQVLTGLAGLLK